MRILQKLHFLALGISIPLMSCHPATVEAKSAAAEPVLQEAPAAEPQAPVPAAEVQAERPKQAAAAPGPDTPRRPYRYYFPDPEPEPETEALLAYLYKPLRPQAPVPKAEPEPAEEKKPEPPAEPEPAAPAAEVKKPEPEPEPAAEDEEYLRSVADVQVTKDEFSEDKRAILQIISEMDGIMQKRDYVKWLQYITPDSVSYYQNQRNLARASERLPYKGMTMKNLQDYFRLVFIPARKGRAVDEIRYVSQEYVKAVQIMDNQDVVYYYFRKINGKWLIHLPPLD